MEIRCTFLLNVPSKCITVVSDALHYSRERLLCNRVFTVHHIEVEIFASSSAAYNAYKLKLHTIPTDLHIVNQILEVL